MSRRRVLAMPSSVGDQQEELPGAELAAATVPSQEVGGVLSGITGADTSTPLGIEHLPTPYIVAPEVVSPLTKKERADLEVCEQALHGFRKAVIMAGKALEVISRARLYRETHPTFAEYVQDKWGIRKSQAYRLIEEWPVAVAVSPIGDINEAQARELLPVFKEHGQAATVVLFREARELAGGKVTAAALAEAREVLPPRLASPEQAADVLRVAAAEGRVPRIVPPRVAPDTPPVVEAEPAPTAADISRQDARIGAEAVAVLEAALAQQRQIYDRLAGVVPQAMAYDPGRAEQLLGELRQFAHRTAHRARGRSVNGAPGEE